MKFYKSLGLLAAAAGLLMTGCANGVSSEKDIVEAAAKTDALIVSSSGGSYSSSRVNNLVYDGSVALYLANSMAAEARVKDASGKIVTDFVPTKVTWTLSGDGAQFWTHKSLFDDKANDYQYWKGVGTEEASVTFTATITYGSASTTVAYNFLMCPKA